LTIGVFETAGGLLAHVAAGVDVDRDQRLGLVDHDRAARLEPHFALQRLVDLGLHAVLVEDRERLGVQLHLPGQVRHDRLDELDHPVELVLVVDADRLVLLGQQVAQQLADQALLLVDERRRAARLRLLPDLGPDRMERLEVLDDVLFRAGRTRRCG
jgi:hypothetical protein